MDHYDERLKKIETSIDTVTRSVARIENAVIGDEKFKQQGLIDKVEEHEKKIEIQEKFIQEANVKEGRRQGAMYVISAMIGTAASLVVALFTKK